MWGRNFSPGQVPPTALPHIPRGPYRVFTAVRISPSR
jgi:hypothetical protein